MYGHAAKRAPEAGSSRRISMVIGCGGAARDDDVALEEGGADSVGVYAGRGAAVSRMRSRQGGNWCTALVVQVAAT